MVASWRLKDREYRRRIHISIAVRRDVNVHDARAERQRVDPSPRRAWDMQAEVDELAAAVTAGQGHDAGSSYGTVRTCCMYRQAGVGGTTRK